MSRTNSSREVTHNNSNEGTAARTRPVRVEEILSRRKKNLDPDGIEGAKEARESFEKDDNGVLSDRGLESKKDTKDTVKANSRRLEDAISKEQQEHFENKDKENRDSVIKMKLKSNYRKSSRDKERSRVKESKNEKQSHHKSRTSNHSGANPEKESEKKQPKISIEKDKYEERDIKSGKEGKRKHESHIDDKNRSVADGSMPKKHDSVKLRDAEYSERRDRKKEHSRIHHEETRTKRRRSRSWEYDRERDRSASMSPRAHRRSNHGRDYDEPVSQSSKDKPRRKYSDADKYRTSGNGGYGGGHYRKHRSGLGGYSPRKRRTGAAVKTPSPMKRSPEKKSSTWDQPPVGTSHGGSGSLFATLQSSSNKMLELTSSTAVTPTTAKPQPVQSLDAKSLLINASIDSVQLTQATRPMRRLYMENLPPSASEKSLIDCLNDFLLSSGVNHIQGAKPCISCIINKEKCQAVVEFLTPEDATSAISLDGRYLSGSVLKIRRPKDFVEAATGAPEKTVPTVKAISEVVKDSPHKIFIGGISKALSSDMLLEVVGAFGLLRAYHFEFNEELNGPCAFLEYEDQSVTHKACAGLNGMKLGGHVLTAVQAFLDSNGDEDDAENLPCYDIPSHAKSLLADSTQVLQLKNVFNLEEFLLPSESELEETLEDIRLECTRFGTVKSINLVRFNIKTEGASEGSDQQDPHVDSAKIRSAANSPSNNSKDEDSDLLALDDVRQHQDVRHDVENTNSNDENPVEDFERKESASPSPKDRDSSQLEVPSGLGKGAGISTEESLGLESCPVSEIPLQEVDITGDNTANVEAHASNGGSGQVLVEITNPNTIVADEGGVGDGDGNHQTQDVEVFEPGSILVEFLRKEAACAAAHCFHRRYYGERIVSASYVSHDLYIERFPR